MAGIPNQGVKANTFIISLRDPILKRVLPAAIPTGGRKDSRKVGSIGADGQNDRPAHLIARSNLATAVTVGHGTCLVPGCARHSLML
jgi:hypothetical protein